MNICPHENLYMNAYRLLLAKKFKQQILFDNKEN